MPRLLTILALVALLAVPAMAAQTYTYSWDNDGTTFLGSFGAVDASLTADDNYPSSAGYGLLLTKTNNVLAGYGTAFVACIWGLQEGDQISADFMRYDPEPGYPRLRLWAHYNDSLGAPDNRNHDTMVNDGLAYGDNSFGTESGWDNPSFTWTVPAGHTGLVIDAVVYGDMYDEIVVDDLTVTVPDHAHVQMPDCYYEPGQAPVDARTSTWGGVKALFE